MIGSPPMKGDTDRTWLTVALGASISGSAA
jgi:hypothetical protein